MERGHAPHPEVRDQALRRVGREGQPSREIFTQRRKPMRSTMAVVLVVLLSGLALGEIPQVISYQGR